MTISKFARDWRAEHRPGSPAKIVADVELRRFIEDRIERMSFRDLAVACRAEFGPARAPGKTTISNYFRGKVKGAPERPPTGTPKKVTRF
jgi:hypothetical protein